jgi:deazaflavin-dependent oxidoreductase (nitroreductase family)
MSDYDQALIDELRSNRGEIAAGQMAGRPLLVLTTTGARSGKPREAVLTFTRDGDRYVVTGTAGGSPRTPAWVHNLTANPVVKIEAKGRSFQAHAAVVDETERQRLWVAHVAERPEFADYPAKSGRVIPVITLEPVGGA